jgi:hypothetical protein
LQPPHGAADASRGVRLARATPANTYDNCGVLE